VRRERDTFHDHTFIRLLVFVCLIRARDLSGQNFCVFDARRRRIALSDEMRLHTLSLPLLRDYYY